MFDETGGSPSTTSAADGTSFYLGSTSGALETTPVLDESTMSDPTGKPA